MNFVPGEGSFRPLLMIIGEAPGATEDQERRPFVGASGSLLRDTLDKLGIDMRSVYITNMIKFRPENNRDPERDEISDHLPLLFGEMGVINPFIVLTLGRHASDTLLKPYHRDFKLTEDRGLASEIKYRYSASLPHYSVSATKEVTVLPTYHPAYVMRNPAVRERWEKDILLAYNLAKEVYYAQESRINQ